MSIIFHRIQGLRVLGAAWACTWALAAPGNGWAQSAPGTVASQTVTQTAANATRSEGHKPAPKKTRTGPKNKAGSTSPTGGTRLGTSASVREFAADVAQRRALPEAWVLAQLEQARLVQAVRRLIMPAPAGTAKNWQAYRARFTTPDRVAAGAAFWRDNQALLEQAEERYGVPPQIVVGILGVETFYGRIMGNFRVIDALATLAFHFPEGRSDRSAFFKTELEEFLVLTRRENVSPQSVKGSYAGAMGLPQFMPSSTNKFAVDFDGNGHIQLHDNTADVVGSVANYLAVHGWQRQMPPYFEAIAPTDLIQRAVLLAPDITPSFSATQMLELGATLSEPARSHVGALALVELENGDAPASHVAGTQNFYVITRYNRSSYYAMAVIELGEAVARARR